MKPHKPQSGRPGAPHAQPVHTVLLTGASSGIGYELSRLFAARRYNLVLVARDQRPLRSVARELAAAFGVSVRAIPIDLALPSSPQKLYNRLRRVPIDILVNNAGVATYGRFADVETEADLRLLSLNVVALTHLTKLFLRDMIRRGSGGILNVASAAGFQPGPLRSTYFASKAYVLSFTEALAAELKGTGIRVTALCPGQTRTKLHERAGMGGTRWAEGKRMDPRVVADAGFHGLMKGKVVVIPGMKQKILAQSVRFVPRSVVRNVVKRMQERRAGGSV